MYFVIKSWFDDINKGCQILNQGNTPITITEIQNLPIISKQNINSFMLFSKLFKGGGVKRNTIQICWGEEEGIQVIWIIPDILVFQ